MRPGPRMPTVRGGPADLFSMYMMRVAAIVEMVFPRAQKLNAVRRAILGRMWNSYRVLGIMMDHYPGAARVASQRRYAPGYEVSGFQPGEEFQVVRQERRGLGIGRFDGSGPRRTGGQRGI